jgi:phosphomannomutase
MKKQYQCVDCPKLIFRAYDIRGIVDKEMNADVYFTLGFALAELMKPSGDMNVCVARDGRLTSEEYLDALEQGLLANGAKPTRVGMLPTPLMYYTCARKRFLHGLMITGSHNPKNYNGLKIILNGYTLKEEGISEIFEVTQKLHQTVFTIKEHQAIEAIDITADYMDYIINHVKFARPLKVVFDYGNGVGAAIGPQLFHALGCETINLNDTVDGHFPAHHPDPTIAENLLQLQKALKDNDADVGIAFDGDGDRLGVVAPNGEIIWPDRLMMIFSQALLKKKPNAKIVYDVKCTRQLPLFIEQLGGYQIMSPTGHSLVKNLMKITHADLAGEMSGHIFFQDQWFGFDDATNIIRE